MNDPFVSKHDPTAYKGKMDRLTFSKRLSYLQDSCYDKMRDTRAEPGHELINLQIEAKNAVLQEMVDLINKIAEETLSTEKDALNWYFKITKEDLE